MPASQALSSRKGARVARIKVVIFQRLRLLRGVLAGATTLQIVTNIRHRACGNQAVAVRDDARSNWRDLGVPTPHGPGVVDPPQRPLSEAIAQRGGGATSQHGAARLAG